MKKIIFTVLFVLFDAAALWATEPFAVSPTSLLDRVHMYQNLALFWVAIIGLIIIVKLKLKEIERIQKMGIDKDDKDASILS
jgi:hypothetical protein